MMVWKVNWRPKQNMPASLQEVRPRILPFDHGAHLLGPHTNNPQVLNALLGSSKEAPSLGAGAWPERFRTPHFVPCLMPYARITPTSNHNQVAHKDLMPSFTARCMLWAALFAGAFVVLDAACPALAVKLRAPTQVHAGKALNYRIRVTLPQKSGLINATTLQLDLPLANEVQTIHVTPKNSDVTVRTVGSTTYFEGMREAKRYNFKVKVGH